MKNLTRRELAQHPDYNDSTATLTLNLSELSIAQAALILNLEDGVYSGPDLEDVIHLVEKFDEAGRKTAQEFLKENNLPFPYPATGVQA